MATTPIGPYSPIVRAGGWLVTSGQLGMVDGKLISGGLPAELRLALENIRGLLEAEGATMDQVVKTTVFLHHLSDYATMNEVYTAAFGDNRPARSAVAVAELPLGALVEIEAWAWIGD